MLKWAKTDVKMLSATQSHHVTLFVHLNIVQAYKWENALDCGVAS